MKKAFTLVELLMAVLLLTLLIGTALFSYRQILINIKKTNTASISEVLKIHQLRTSVESMQYYVVDDYNVFGTPMKNLHYFFYGTPSMMSYITLNPIFSKKTSVVKVECTPEKTLKYIEEPLYGRIDFKNPKIIDDSQEHILWKKIKGCQFKYFTIEGSVDSLKGDIPASIKISFINKSEKLNTFFIRIKNDDNLSKERVYEAIYGYEG